MSANILRQLNSHSALRNSIEPAFCRIDNAAYLLAIHYSQPFSRTDQSAKPSNVYDFNSGNQLILGDLDKINPALFDQHKLTLSPGQEMSSPGLS